MNDSTAMAAMQQAKNKLENLGFFVDNLWHIMDVQQHGEGISEVAAFRILEDVLTSDYVVETINAMIEDKVNYELQNYEL